MGKYVVLISLVLVIIAIIIIKMQVKTNQPPLETPTMTPIPVATEQPIASPSASQIEATIKTAKGDIVLTLFINEAPKTVANFVSKAKSGYYNNLTWHRVEDWVIQGGDPSGNGTGGGQMDTELNNKPFVIGSLGVARGGDIKISNDSQFFIIKTEASWLNNQYTNFGLLTSGMDVVNKIAIGDKILNVTIKE